jgi:hypothetical protein
LFKIGGIDLAKELRRPGETKDVKDTITLRFTSDDGDAVKPFITRWENWYSLDLPSTKTWENLSTIFNDILFIRGKL